MPQVSSITSMSDLRPLLISLNCISVVADEYRTIEEEPYDPEDKAAMISNSNTGTSACTLVAR